jgi:hypothetical protein
VSPGLGTALAEMTASFERLCLAAGLEALGAMLEADAAALCGPRHGRGAGAAGAALGPDDRSDRLPRRQGPGDPSAAAGAWRRTGSGAGR